MFATSNVLLLVILIIGLNICLVYSTANNNIRGRRFICNSHEPDLVKVKCTFRKLNWTTELWSFDLDYLVPFENLHINVTNYRQQQNLQYKPQTVIGYHIDLCKWIDGSLINKLVDILSEDLKRFGNSLTPCPQYGKLYMRNMTFNDKFYPPIVQSGFTYLDFQFYSYINGSIRNLYYMRPYFEINYKTILQW